MHRCTKGVGPNIARFQWIKVLYGPVFALKFIDLRHFFAPNFTIMQG